MSKNLVIVETERQVEWAIARRPSLLTDGLVIAATPDAAHACQKAGIGYSRIEDLTALGRRRSEYKEGLHEYLAWEAWVDEWARQCVPEFGRTSFMPAQGASLSLQMVHAEIWSTGRCLAELFDKLKPDTVTLWRPLILGVPSYLQPAVNPMVVLAADMAVQRGIPVRDLAAETPELRVVASVQRNDGIRSALRHALFNGRIRQVAAAYVRGGVGDALRCLVPVWMKRDAVLVCGFGYDVQGLVLELRRTGVAVRQVPEPPGVQPVDDVFLRSLEGVAQRLLAEPRFWEPVERCGVARTDLWKEPVLHWWRGILPATWSSFLAAQRHFRKSSYRAVVIAGVNEQQEGPMAAAAKESAIPTFLYQHGGSSDLDSLELMGWLRGADTMLLYGEGTAADLSETLPTYASDTASLVAVGSARLDEIAARRKVPAREQLRAELQNGDSRPLVLYVPTHFSQYARAIGELADLPVVSYFEMLQGVLSLWKDAPGVRLVYKDFRVANDQSRLMPDFIRDNIPNAIVTSQRITDLMWSVDAIVVDHVITAAAEVLVTNKPCVFFMPSQTAQAKRARGLLAARARVATTGEEFVESVRELLDRTEFPPLESIDRRFLAAYGTHLDDCGSAKRAVRAIMGHEHS
jgi:hypothetical protein